MTTPSITPAQIVAFVQPFLTLLIAFGLPLTDLQVTAIIGVSGSLSTALVIADMFIRRARANNATAIAAAKVAVSQIEPTPAPAYINLGE